MTKQTHLSFTTEVRVATTKRFAEYLKENLSKSLTAAEEARLVRGVHLAFMYEDVQELIYQSYQGGASVEAVAQVLYLGRTITNAVKAIWGFKAKFKMAQMLSAAAYACSPQSEAYWAS